MISAHPSPVVRSMIRIAQPLLILFGVYVLCHGHESPGGGFQAGTILAAALLAEALAFGVQSISYRRSRRALFLGAAVGLLIYAGIGCIGLFGYQFLDYAALPLPLDEPARRWWGIFGVELGVCLVVCCSLTTVFDRLVNPEPIDG